MVIHKPICSASVLVNAPALRSVAKALTTPLNVSCAPSSYAFGDHGTISPFWMQPAIRQASSRTSTMLRFISVSPYFARAISRPPMPHMIAVKTASTSHKRAEPRDFVALATSRAVILEE